MVDAGTFGELIKQRREQLSLSFRGAGALVGLHGNTWSAHEKRYRVVDGRKQQQQRETPYTDALMALAVGVKLEELDAIGRPDVAQALRDILAGQTKARKTVNVTAFHVRWLREQYEQAETDGEFLDRMKALIDNGRSPKRRPRRQT
jgi:hypothetical protein